MKPITRPGYALIALAALAASALLVASCSDKPLSVDPSFDTPEGSPSGAAQLVVWPSQPTTAAVYREVPPVGAGPEDTFLRYESFRRRPDGTPLGMVFDGTQASAFQVLRRESNGGLRQLTDFAVHSTRRWLDGKWEVYEFADPLPTSSPSYIGRGLIAGGVTENSPLSNEARLATPTVADIPFTYPTDTTVAWGPVAGAAFYIAHIYQLREAPAADRILSGAPAPIYRGYSRDFFLGFTTTPQVLGRNRPFTGTVLTRRDLTPGTYLARVAAVDAQGQLIAYSYGDSGLQSADVTYSKFPLGAATIPRPVVAVGGGGPGPERASAARRPDDMSGDLAKRRRY